MATGGSRQSLIDDDGSDMIYVYTCSPCDANNLNSEALYYCTQCRQQYCAACEPLHRKLFKSHHLVDVKEGKDASEQSTRGVISLGMEDMNTLLVKMCDDHHNERIKMFCGDHGQLCCTVCVSIHHRACKVIKHLPDVARNCRHDSEYCALIDEAENIKTKLADASRTKRENIKLLEIKREGILTKIEDKHTQLVAHLESMKKKTINQVNETSAILEQKIEQEVELFENAGTELKHLAGMLDDRNAKNDSTAFIILHKSKDKIKEASNALTTSMGQEYKIEYADYHSLQSLVLDCPNETYGEVTTVPTSIGQTVKKKFGLNKFNYEKRNTQKYKVRQEDDKKPCCISSIWLLPYHMYALVDQANYSIKLLAKYGGIASSMKMTSEPLSVCYAQFDDMVVATADNTLQYVHFKNHKLRQGRTIKLPHECRKLYRYYSSLYIASPTAIYAYFVDGKLMQKIYEDTSDTETISNFTVNADIPSGEGLRFFINNKSTNVMTIVDYTGTKLFQLSSETLMGLDSLCAVLHGDIFVGVESSRAIYHVTKTGKLTSADGILVEADDIDTPRAMWFDVTAMKLMVGQDKDYVLMVSFEKNN